MNQRFAGSEKGSTRVLELDALVAVLQEEVELAEHLGDVRAVELVDQEHERRIRLGACSLGDAPQGTCLQREGRAVRGRVRAVALDEVLVGVGRMELNEPHARREIRIADEQICKALRDVGLPRTRRSVEDDLALSLEQTPDTAKIGDVEQETRAPTRQGRRPDRAPGRSSPSDTSDP